MILLVKVGGLYTDIVVIIRQYGMEIKPPEKHLIGVVSVQLNTHLATLKKSVFPVQRGAKVVFSRAAANIFFTSFLGGKKFKYFFEKKKTEKKKKFPSWQENIHPAAGPETNIFLRMA